MKAPAKPGIPPSWVLAGAVLGSGLAFVDFSAVNLTLPVIQQRLGGGLDAAQWVMNAYALMLGALVLAGGAAADRYGRKRVFVAGVLLFTVASAVCGLAPSLPVLLAARAVQGIGAALLTPASLALLGAAYDAKSRGQAVGIWAGASGLTSADGPGPRRLADPDDLLAGGVLHQPAGGRIAVWLVWRTPRRAGRRAGRWTGRGPGRSPSAPARSPGR